MAFAHSSRARDYYAELGVSRHATEAEVRKAFLEKARIWHPDKCTAPDAADRFRTIHEAFETLKSAAQRRTYDATLAAASRKVVTLRSATSPATAKFGGVGKQGYPWSTPAAQQQAKPKAALSSLLAALQKDATEATLPDLRRMCTECRIVWPLGCLERPELVKLLSAKIKKELNLRVVYAANLKNWDSIPKEDIIAWLELQGVSLKFAMECDCIGKDKLVMLVLGELAKGNSSATPSPAHAATSAAASAAASSAPTAPQNSTDKAQPDTSATSSAASHSKPRRSSPLGDLYATYCSLISQGQAAAAKARAAAAKAKSAPQQTPKKHAEPRSYFASPQQAEPRSYFASPPRTPVPAASAEAAEGKPVTSPQTRRKQRAPGPRHPQPKATGEQEKAKKRKGAGKNEARSLKRARKSPVPANEGQAAEEADMPYEELVAQFESFARADAQRAKQKSGGSSSSASRTSTSSSDSSSEDSDDSSSENCSMQKQAAATNCNVQDGAAPSNIQKRLKEVRCLLESARRAEESVEKGKVLPLIAEIEAAENQGRIDVQMLKFTGLGVELNKAWWRRETQGETGNRASALVAKWMARFRAGASK